MIRIMIQRPELTEAAVAEYIAAARWYESNRTSRGRALALAVEAALDHIADQPQAHRLIPEIGVRRRVVRRFPYALLYRLETNRPIVTPSSTRHETRPY